MTADRDLVTDLAGTSEDDRLVLLIGTALRSVERALVEIDMEAPDTLARFDDLAREAAARQTGIVNLVMVERIRLNTPLAAMFLLGLIHKWDPNATDALRTAASAIGELWSPSQEQRGLFESQVVEVAVEAIYGLAAPLSGETLSSSRIARAAAALYQLALTLSSADRVGAAISCAHSCANVSFDDTTRAELALGLATTLSSQKGDVDAVAIAVSRLADTLVRAARKDPTRQLAAYDAIDRALGVLSQSDTARRTYLERLWHLIASEPYLRPMLLIASNMLPPDQRPDFIHREIDDDTVAGAALATPVVASSLEDFLRSIGDLVPWHIAIENRRLGLERGRAAEVAETNWDTWSVDHPALRRAVPNSSSLLREQNLDNILLVLHHEISHVYSMAGFIGVALIVIRWAIFDREAELWTLTKSASKAFDVNDLSRSITTQLGRASPEILAVAEQQLELERKLQIVEDVWSPWLEGVAVFGEVAADPRHDSSAVSPTVEILFNLWDRSIGSMAADATRPVDEVATEEWLRTETLFGDAIERSSRYRLRAYLDNHHRHYLAGYLAVRATVARWRRTLGGALNGAQAFRILLHVTRYSDLSAFPDVKLPLPEFCAAVSEHQVEWLRSIAEIDAEDLKRIRDYGEVDDTKSYRWISGKLRVWERSDELTRQLENQIAKIGGQATFSLRTDTARVQGADGDCRTMMTAAWQFLAPKREPEFHTVARVSSTLSRLMILVLGSASCPFWLNPDSKRMACLIRTTESAKDSGEPSYDLVLPRLTDAEFDELLARTRFSGERRMVVSRVADLQDRQTGRGRGMGRHLLVFRYGEWMHIQPAGMLSGSDDVDASLRKTIAYKLNPPTELLTVPEKLAGNDHRAARRTLGWIDACNWAVELGQVQADLTPWAKYVRELAEAVLVRGGGADSEVASLQLLRFVLLDPALVKRVRARGFSDVREISPTAFDELVQLLWETGYGPVADREGLANLVLGVSEHIAPLLELTAAGWDITSSP